MVVMLAERPDVERIPAALRTLVPMQPLHDGAIASYRELMRTPSGASLARALTDLVGIAKRGGPAPLHGVALGVVHDDRGAPVAIRWAAADGYTMRMIDYRPSTIITDDLDVAVDTPYTLIGAYHYRDIAAIAPVIAQSRGAVTVLHDAGQLAICGEHRAVGRWVAQISPYDEHYPVGVITTDWVGLSAQGGEPRQVRLAGAQIVELARQAEALAREHKSTYPRDVWSRVEVMLGADIDRTIWYRLPPYQDDWTQLRVADADVIDTVSLNATFLPAPSSSNVTLLVPPAQTDRHTGLTAVLRPVHLIWYDGDAHHHHVIMPMLPMSEQRLRTLLVQHEQRTRRGRSGR